MKQFCAFSLTTLVLHDNVFIRDVWDQWNPQVSQGSTLTPFSSHFSCWVISATQKAVTTTGTITDLLPVSRVIYPAAIWTSPGNVLEVTTLLSLVLLQSQKLTPTPTPPVPAVYLPLGRLTASETSWYSQCLALNKYRQTEGTSKVPVCSSAPGPWLGTYSRCHQANLSLGEEETKQPCTTSRILTAFERALLLMPTDHLSLR